MYIILIIYSSFYYNFKEIIKKSFLYNKELEKKGFKMSA